MSYSLDFTKKAVEDIEYYKKSGNKEILNKLFVLIEAIAENPNKGIGKPEQLKHQLTGLWSRRINKEHRIIYEINEYSVLIHSVRGHYTK
ncbi:MAG: Txe/YoeB family addiction module toxin [Saprospiraceae bacterium]|nr:Txe/YoeB family addiction module toxin [Saprospiraceae bacterium]